MKKAAGVISVTLTLLVLLGTVAFYFIHNLPSGPLYIRSLYPTAARETSETDDPPVNINTANLQQLMTLPGIGEVLAQRILDYREEHGPFQSPGELLNVSGIGETKLQEILDHITTGGST